ncbi:hypothetical protein [Leuconostoc lactis]|uniref:hypothetical protein n=1 Tax=Leuconostoc lactis TaxID=1246 RepID=UPI0022E44916|nr:hypothetical protein [Leuconostoc lactis]
MKYIRNISDEQNKVGDTDNVFRLNLFEDDKLFDFGTNNLTVNIANSSGYILSLTPKKETGNTVIDLDFNDAPLKSLTPDDYLLEVEVKFSDGTKATFPTKGGMPFTVNGNLKETSGTLVPTVTFDNVLDAVDKKIAVYMDTVKVGPAGPVGPAGSVDASHDNTFTGANKFTQLIDGALKTRQATFTDFAQVAADMNTYAGQWRVGTTPVANSPVAGLLYYIIEVVPDSSGTAGIIRVVQYGNQKYYYNVVNGGLLTGWHLVAQDENVVHNTGNETVAGDKALTGKITFSQQINGGLATRDAIFADFNAVFSAMNQYAGNWRVTTTPVANSPVAGMTQYVVNVINYGVNAGSVSVTALSGKKTYITGVSGGAATGWVLVADDGGVVHNTGNEIVNGDKTFKSGNYGLRVTTAGVQKTSDGGTTWTNI